MRSAHPAVGRSELELRKIRLLADRVEGNLLAASQEIEKLRLLLGEGKVTVADVTGAVAKSSRYDVYKLADAAMAQCATFILITSW